MTTISAEVASGAPDHFRVARGLLPAIAMSTVTSWGIPGIAGTAGTAGVVGAGGGVRVGGSWAAGGVSGVEVRDFRVDRVPAPVISCAFLCRRPHWRLPHVSDSLGFRERQPLGATLVQRRLDRRQISVSAPGGAGVTTSVVRTVWAATVTARRLIHAQPGRSPARSRAIRGLRVRGVSGTATPPKPPRRGSPSGRCVSAYKNLSAVVRGLSLGLRRAPSERRQPPP